MGLWGETPTYKVWGHWFLLLPKIGHEYAKPNIDTDIFLSNMIFLCLMDPPVLWLHKISFGWYLSLGMPEYGNAKAKMANNMAIVAQFWKVFGTDIHLAGLEKFRHLQIIFWVKGVQGGAAVFELSWFTRSVYHGL